MDCLKRDSKKMEKNLSNLVTNRYQLDNDLVHLSQKNWMPWSALQVNVYRDGYVAAHDEIYHQPSLPGTYQIKCCFLISRKLPTLHSC